MAKVDSKAVNRLLVEGKDDLHSVIHLLRRHGIDYDNPSKEMPYLDDTEGYSKLLETISVAAKTYKRLGILVDADISVDARWDAVAAKLNAIGLHPPSEPSANGSVFSGLLPESKIGVWLMPNNVDPGMLETFLGYLVPDDDKCFAYAGIATTEANRLGAGFASKHFDKAKIHTWLAWQEDPGQPFGTAITASCFKTDTLLATSFVQWYRNVFLL